MKKLTVFKIFAQVRETAYLGTETLVAQGTTSPEEHLQKAGPGNPWRQ
jgi:hypothetical protein